MKREHFLTFILLVFCFSIGASVAETPIGTLKLPENVSVELISPEHGTLMFNGATGAGTFQLPQGSYRLESWTLEKKGDKGHLWKLSGDVNTARMIDIGAEPTELSIQTEPIHCDLSVHPGSEAMNFTLGLNGPSGERLRVSGDAPGVKSDQLPQPTFVLYNANKSFEKSYDFQSQCCGNYRFNWTPPSNVEGPFFVDLKVAGPFQIDFEPVNLSELHQNVIAEQQARRAREMKQLYIMGLCYIIALAVIVGVLIRFRKSIFNAMKKAEGTLPVRRLTLILFVLVLLMLLDPVLLLIFGDAEIQEVIFQCGIVTALLLVGALVVWGVRKVRTKWPFVTIMLYGVFFILLLIPIVVMVFVGYGDPDTELGDVYLDDWFDFYGELFSFDEIGVWIAWGIIIAMLTAQVSLLIVPVRIKHQRPKKRRGIWWTAIVAALLYTVLLFFAGLSIMCAAWGDDLSEIVFWILVGILPLNWIGWSIMFCLFSRSMEPESFIRRLMNWLIGGSILELLIAVPSHIIVRHRDVCCAHGLTAAGLTAGIAVIFFAFGPGLYFLYADRIRSRTPNISEMPEQASGDIPLQE